MAIGGISDENKRDTGEVKKQGKVTPPVAKKVESVAHPLRKPLPPDVHATPHAIHKIKSEAAPDSQEDRILTNVVLELLKGRKYSEAIEKAKGIMNPYTKGTVLGSLLKAIPVEEHVDSLLDLINSIADATVHRESLRILADSCGNDYLKKIIGQAKDETLQDQMYRAAYHKLMEQFRYDKALDFGMCIKNPQKKNALILNHIHTLCRKKMEKYLPKAAELIVQLPHDIDKKQAREWVVNAYVQVSKLDLAFRFIDEISDPFEQLAAYQNLAYTISSKEGSSTQIARLIKHVVEKLDVSGLQSIISYLMRHDDEEYTHKKMFLTSGTASFGPQLTQALQNEIRAPLSIKDRIGAQTLTTVAVASGFRAPLLKWLQDEIKARVEKNDHNGAYQLSKIITDAGLRSQVQAELVEKLLSLNEPKRAFELARAIKTNKYYHQALSKIVQYYNDNNNPKEAQKIAEMLKTPKKEAEPTPPTPDSDHPTDESEDDEVRHSG